MADRRAVRSSSRRMTPTPQPPSKANTPQPGRTTRRRGTRSASRDVERPVEAAKPTRRSARQASVTSVPGEGELEPDVAPKTKRRGQKEATGDLTTVEELDTQIALEDAPHTPPRLSAEVAMPHRSPGAASEMSGTTAISSFSMVQAEMLEPRFMLRHLPKLFEVIREFLEHLVPADGRIEDDNEHIREMQMPGSEFIADYNDYNNDATLRLSHFRGEDEQYINLRAVHRALFGPFRDSAALSSGLDLVLYLANLLIFAKQMIHADRSDKEMWTALVALDKSFPTLFLPGLVPGISATHSFTGDSALLQETFELALELRTQLAILYLERESNGENFNPDQTLEEVFFQSTDDNDSVVRGWGIYVLGGETSALPQALQSKVIDRMNAMRDFFPTDTESLERGEAVDLDGLGANFPWNSVILRLLGWVRLRNNELQAAIQNHDGISSIVQKVKAEMEQPNENETGTAAPTKASPRKKRSSFGRSRRRSSRKFDPNADVDNIVVDKLIARERGSGVQPLAGSSQQEPQHDEGLFVTQEEDNWQAPLDDDEQQAVEDLEEAEEEIAGPSGPPQSTAEILKLLKEGKRLDKENRAISLFERQVNAQRVDFGDGFDEASQPTPGPSSKGKQPQRPSPRKRRRPVEEESDDEEAFQTEQRVTKVQERREKAKRVRIDPSSSRPPTSHQPEVRNEDADFQPVEQDESPSEHEAPDMTEVPPPSSYRDQKRLARSNVQGTTVGKSRKARTGWTIQEEEALIGYMADLPQKYAAILEKDKGHFGHHVLEERTQVNLKDKVRNMAITMIKSGAGLRPGFGGVITPDSAIGRKLLDDGFEW